MAWLISPLLGKNMLTISLHPRALMLIKLALAGIVIYGLALLFSHLTMATYQPVSVYEVTLDAGQEKALIQNIRTMARAEGKDLIYKTVGGHQGLPGNRYVWKQFGFYTLEVAVDITNSFRPNEFSIITYRNQILPSSKPAIVEAKLLELAARSNLTLTLRD